MASASGRWRCGPSRPTAPAYALQEILTIKSDDVLGRVKVYEAIVKGENIPEPGIPESFKVLIKEMQALCLNVKVMNEEGEEVEIRELDEDAFRTTEALGIDLSPSRAWDRRRGRGPRATRCPDRPDATAVVPPTTKQHEKRGTRCTTSTTPPGLSISLATAEQIRTWSQR